MRFDIVTIFPEMFNGPFSSSIIKRAVDDGKIEISLHNLRQWARDKHHVTDDYPFGGGPGMVMKVGPIAEAVDDLRGRFEGSVVALMTPQGEPLTHGMAKTLSSLPGLIILCGRYEGVDERVRSNYCDMEISIGDYVLTGGEIPAMALVDTVARLVPGVVGDIQSTVEESHSGYLLEYPQYTRPADYKELKTPEVLLSGDHAKIERWRRDQSILRTARRRPDLLEKAGLTDEEKQKLKQTMDKEDIRANG